ncbi:LacI family DNA-binding transcriptional regulator [Clostridium paraputrificum]|uniref:LacI family DNA-binding transcriptional regulator n=1 Tax=Clostridium paraputrificum TaxID=29363 RepID=UPI003D350DCD
MKVTIAEVAEKANVSVATVSRVMNGNYPVKAETKENVLKAIKELKYIPNMQARELTQQRSSIIGVVVPSINNMFFPAVIDGIDSSLKSNSLSFILCCTNGDKNEEMKYVNELISRNVSGIIVISPDIKNMKSKFYNDIAKQIPIVFVNGSSTSPNISTVCNDEAKGARIALDYLFENNHKDILFIRGTNSYSYDVKEECYREFMMDIDNFKEENIINIGSGNSSETVGNTTSILLDILESTTATAIFACNDLMGVGAINACKRLNINVPKDMSIIGFDNIELCKFIEPNLTTIDQNMSLLGENAASLLLEKININNEYSKNIILNNTLIKRETVSMDSDSI